MNRKSYELRSKFRHNREASDPQEQIPDVDLQQERPHNPEIMEGQAQNIDPQLAQQIQVALQDLDGALHDVRQQQTVAQETSARIEGELNNFRDFSDTTTTALGHIQNTQNTARTQLLPPEFSGKLMENPNKFLTHFDRYAQFAGHDNAGKTNLIPLLLKSKAANWYSTLDPAIKNDWQQLRPAITQKFGPQNLGQIRETQLLDRKQGKTETVSAYTQDMINRLDMVEMNPRE